MCVPWKIRNDNVVVLQGKLSGDRVPQGMILWVSVQQDESVFGLLRPVDEGIEDCGVGIAC